MTRLIKTLCAATLLFACACAHAKPTLEQAASFDIQEANQGAGVDAEHFYAIDNQTIAKYEKKTGPSGR
jgi:hypothetical protein